MLDRDAKKHNLKPVKDAVLYLKLLNLFLIREKVVTHENYLDFKRSQSQSKAIFELDMISTIFSNNCYYLSVIPKLLPTF